MDINNKINRGYPFKGIPLIFTIILLLNSQFLLIKPVFDLFRSVNTYHNKLLITILVIACFFFHCAVWLLKKRYVISLLDLSVVLFALMTLFILTFQIATSNELKNSLIGNAYYNLIILFYFPLKELLNSNNGFIKTIRIIIGIGFLYTLITIFIFLLIKFSSIANLNDWTMIQYTNGILRLPQTADIIGVTSILSLCQLVYEKRNNQRNKTMLFLIFIIGFLSLIFISMVRMMALTVFVTTFLIVFTEIPKRMKKVLIIVFIFFISPIILIVNQKLNMINLFLGEGQRYASAMYRLQEIAYYSKHMFDYRLFGFGFSQKVTLAYSITDIGFLGFVFKYGLLGIFWLTLVITAIIKHLNNSKEKGYSIGIITFVSVSFISLSIFDPQRITFLPVFLAILNFLTRRN